MAARAASIALMISTAGCGYFNALYNAEQKFAEAQRAEADGNRSLAVSSYDAAIERAAVSYRKYPNSRWADDALLLIARARFGQATNSLNPVQDAQAEAAAERLLTQTSDGSIRTQAYAYMGAARTRLGRGDALSPLDSAVANSDSTSETGEFSHLWRARARFLAHDTTGAWQDLDAIPWSTSHLGAEAALERLLRATMTGDTTRWRVAVSELVGSRGTPMRPDSVRVLLDSSVVRWSPAFVMHALPADAGSSLQEEDRLKLRLRRAEIIAAAGDTATAIADGLDVASASSSETAAQARVDVAHWILATSSDINDLSRVRSILVPAFSNGEAFQMIQQIRAIDVLMSRATDVPLAMFVAGEYARDDLHAPRLARTIFVRSDSLAAPNPWAAKALMAAEDLSRNAADRAAIDQMLSRHSADLYVQAAHGTADAEAYANSEATLKREAAVLRAEATAIATAGNVSISRAVSIRDSIRTVMRHDSLQQHCFVVLDSMKVKGIRGDSLRAACVRVDTARFNAVLKIDTTKLKAVKLDTITLPFHSLTR
jgi:hypothetical protein